MTPATAPHLSPADLADQQAEDAQYFRRMLHELIDMGMGLARTAHKQGTAEADGENRGDGPAAAPVHDAAVAFDRLSRAVRRTVALARKVAEPLPVRSDSHPDRVAARRRILREVEDAIGREAEGADVEVLEAELRERLDAPELEDEIGSRPVAEVVADICRDLGLGTMLGNQPWKRRLPADVAALCERAAKPPGAPSADQPGAEPPPALPEVPGRFRTWAGPPAYNREASIELMHTLLEHRLPRIRGP